MAKQIIKPIGQRVLVQRIKPKAEEKTSSGRLYLPETAQKDKSNEAVVIALGTGSKDKDGNDTPFTVAVGDHVMLTNYGGTEVTLADEKYIVINEIDILAVIKTVED